MTRSKPWPAPVLTLLALAGRHSFTSEGGWTNATYTFEGEQPDPAALILEA